MVTNTRQVESLSRAYSAFASVAAAALATDIAILPGSATTTVYVTRIFISGVQTTAGNVEIVLAKRSTANTGGTSAAMTAVPHCSGDAAAVAAPLSYTANPTTGSLVGNLRRFYIPVGPAATSIANSFTVIDLGFNAKPVCLMGVAEGLAINLNGVTVTGGTFDVGFEWREETWSPA